MTSTTNPWRTEFRATMALAWPLILANLTMAAIQATDVVLMGIILIGVIGFGIDLLMRWAERALVPWKGRA